jgi:hypothetical protein
MVENTKPQPRAARARRVIVACRSPLDVRGLRCGVLVEQAKRQLTKPPTPTALRMSARRQLRDQSQSRR